MEIIGAEWLVLVGRNLAESKWICCAHRCRQSSASELSEMSSRAGYSDVSEALRTNIINNCVDCEMDCSCFKCMPRGSVLFFAEDCVGSEISLNRYKKK